MPIRILHVVDNWGMGGLQNGLANLIARLPSEHFEHRICALRPVAAADVQPFAGRSAEVIELRQQTRIQAGALARVIREIRPDIVHSRNWGGVEAVLAGWWVGSCALIHSEHGADGLGGREPWRRIWGRRLAFRLADRVLAVSNQLRDQHARRTGFPAARITVIHNGVDCIRFAPHRPAGLRLREELRIPLDAFCIGCVGNLTPVKDQITVLRALEQLDALAVNWRFLLVGDGPEFPRLRAFVDAHAGWDERVHFLGRSRRVPELLNAMDVYVLSSLTEGICNSLLEAMATGLPVLATDTGGNPEVILDGKSGLLFSVGDSRGLAERLAALSKQPDLRKTLACGALRRVHEQFSIDAMVRNYSELYQSVRPLAAGPARKAASA